MTRKNIILIDSEIVKLRGLGFSQAYIAKKMKMSQANVAYRLNKLKERAEEEGVDMVFLELCVITYLPKLMRLFNVR